MTLTESIKTCFQKYVDFNGRARRSEFWWFFLFCTVSSLIIVSIPLLGQLYMLALLMPSLAVSVRRLHDTDRSAWWLLLLPIAVLGFGVSLVIALGIALMAMFGGSDNERDVLALMMIVSFALFVGCSMTLLIFCALPGTVEPNRYGPDPLTRHRDSRTLRRDALEQPQYKV